MRRVATSQIAGPYSKSGGFFGGLSSDKKAPRILVGNKSQHWGSV